MATGFYPGSFDPLTNGHLDVIEAAAAFCGRLVVGIGVHPGKMPLFPPERRAAMIAEAGGQRLVGKSCTLETMTFDGLTVRAAADCGASVMIRGLRDGSDLDYELQLAGMNAAMAPAIQTVFIPPTAESRAITATLVRQIAKLGGDVSSFVPPVVAAALAELVAPASRG